MVPSFLHPFTEHISQYKWQEKKIKHICLTEQMQSIKGEANIFEHQLEDIPLW